MTRALALLAAFGVSGAAAQTLEVRPGPGERPLDLPLAAGEDRLMDLCLLSGVEDAWVYYERDGRDSWLDVGTQERADEVLIEVPWRRLEGARRVAVYHIHPALDDVVRAARAYRPMAHGDERAFGDLVLGETPGLFARPPGRTDYLGAIELRRQARRRGLDLETRVVVAGGIYDYRGEPGGDLERAWPLLDFEGYALRDGRSRIVAAMAALDLELSFDERRALGETPLFRNLFGRSLRRHSAAWNPPAR